jgi:hypothetical protein
LPERDVAGDANLVTAPGVVDEDVEPSLLSADAREQSFHLSVIEVVAADRHADSAARADLVSGLFDHAGPVERRRFPANAAAGDVHGRALLAEDDCNSPAAAAARAGYDGRLSREAPVVCSSLRSCHRSPSSHAG